MRSKIDLPEKNMSPAANKAKKKRLTERTMPDFARKLSFLGGGVGFDFFSSSSSLCISFFFSF